MNQVTVRGPTHLNDQRAFNTWNPCEKAISGSLRLGPHHRTKRLVIEAIRWQCGQARILHMAADRKVVERLKRHRAESHQVMDRVIEKTTDSRGADACGLRFQIEHLANQPGFPEESAVEPRSVPMQARFEFCDHCQGKRAIASDILVATNLGRQLPRVTLLQKKKG